MFSLNRIMCFVLVVMASAAASAQDYGPGNGGGVTQVRYQRLMQRIVDDIRKPDNQMIVGFLNRAQLADFLDLTKVRFIGGDVSPARCFVPGNSGLYQWENFNDYDQAGHLRLPIAVNNGQIIVNSACLAVWDREFSDTHDEMYFNRALSSVMGIALVKYYGLPYRFNNRTELLRFHDEVVQKLYNTEFFNQLYVHRAGFIEVGTKVIDGMNEAMARHLNIDKNRLRQNFVIGRIEYMYTNGTTFADVTGSEVDARLQPSGLLQVSSEKAYPRYSSYWQTEVPGLDQIPLETKTFYLHEVLRMAGYNDDDYRLSIHFFTR